MNVADATKRIIDAMTSEEQIELYRSAQNIIDQRINPYRPLTKEQVLADLAESRRQIACGEYLDADEALDAIAKQYGL